MLPFGGQSFPVGNSGRRTLPSGQQMVSGPGWVSISGPPGTGGSMNISGIPSDAIVTTTPDGGVTITTSGGSPADPAQVQAKVEAAMQKAERRMQDAEQKMRAAFGGWPNPGAVNISVGIPGSPGPGNAFGSSMPMSSNSPTAPIGGGITPQTPSGGATAAVDAFFRGEGANGRDATAL